MTRSSITQTIRSVLGLTVLVLAVHTPLVANDSIDLDAGAARALELWARTACAAATDVLRVAVHDCRRVTVSRTELVPGIGWYRIDVPVGSGTWDVIRLHRVVAERQPWVPRRAETAVMTVHGDRFTWQATFLTSATAGSIPADQSLAAYLAQNGVDVWGIDFRWTRVPEDVPDTSFMDAWGMALHVRDLRTALALARVTRVVTGSGFGRLHLVGWSRGGYIGYAYLDDEAGRPAFLRHVRGFVPLDLWIRTDDEALRQAACSDLAALEADFEAGETVAPGFFTNEIGRLALEDPEAPSPFFSLFTNRQLGLCVGSFPRATPTPGWHPTGGVYDDDFFFPQFLLYTDEVNWFTHLATGAAYQPLQLVIDAERLVCNEVDSPFDDRLAQVDVPVFYVGGAGGFGDFGVFSTSLLGSSDVSSLVVQQQPPSHQIQDVGHADILLAQDAETWVWQPILDWLEAH